MSQESLNPDWAEAIKKAMHSSITNPDNVLSDDGDISEDDVSPSNVNNGSSSGHRIELPSLSTPEPFSVKMIPKFQLPPPRDLSSPPLSPSLRPPVQRSSARVNSSNRDTRDTRDTRDAASDSEDHLHDLRHAFKFKGLDDTKGSGNRHTNGSSKAKPTKMKKTYSPPSSRKYRTSRREQETESEEDTVSSDESAASVASSDDSEYSRSSRESRNSRHRQTRFDRGERDDRYDRSERLKRRQQDQQMSEEEEKYELLSRIQNMSDEKGYKSFRKLGTQDSIHDIRYEFFRGQREMSRRVSVRLMQKYLVSFTVLMEMVADYYNPLRLKLKGYSKSVLLSMRDYDPILEELHYKYSNSVSTGPELKLVMALASSMFFYHTGHNLSYAEEVDKSTTAQNFDSDSTQEPQTWDASHASQTSDEFQGQGSQRSMKGPHRSPAKMNPFSGGANPMAMMSSLLPAMGMMMGSGGPGGDLGDLDLGGFGGLASFANLGNLGAIGSVGGVGSVGKGGASDLLSGLNMVKTIMNNAQLK